MIICKYGSPTITGILRPGSIQNWLTSNNFLQIAAYRKLQWWYPSTHIASQNSTYLLTNQVQNAHLRVFTSTEQRQYLTDFLVGIRSPRCERRWEDDGVDGSMEGSSSSSVCWCCTSLSSDFSFPQWFGCISKPWSPKGSTSNLGASKFDDLLQTAKMLQISATRTYRVGSCRSS